MPFYGGRSSFAWKSAALWHSLHSYINRHLHMEEGSHHCARGKTFTCSLFWAFYSWALTRGTSHLLSLTSL